MHLKLLSPVRPNSAATECLVSLLGAQAHCFIQSVFGLGMTKIRMAVYYRAPFNKRKYYKIHSKFKNRDVKMVKRE